MAETEDNIEEEPKKKSKMPLILGLVLALIGGGGGFFATYTGMILGAEETEAKTTTDSKMSDVPDVSFVAIQPLTITIATDPKPRHLRFTSQLEVPSAYYADVEKLLPRIVDVFNTYLRALKAEDIEDPSALLRLRSQMLRRANIVTGEGRVNDLLIMEFIIN